jgi:hypothetical protein
MTATNKWCSNPRVVAIWIDVYPAGENPINTSHAFHARSAYGLQPYISCCTRRQPFGSPYTRKKSWKPKQTGPAIILGHLILPHDNLGVVERRFSQVVTQLHRLTGPIYKHAISTFNTCSRGPTHWSLTDIGSSHHTLQLSQWTVLRFPPKGPTQSPV